MALESPDGALPNAEGRVASRGIYPRLLNLDEINHAIRVNNGYGYTPEQIQRIQRIVRVEETGHFDGNTVLAVALWQRDQGLTVDGIAGSITFGLIDALYYGLYVGDGDYAPYSPQRLTAIRQVVGVGSGPFLDVATVRGIQNFQEQRGLAWRSLDPWASVRLEFHCSPPN